MTRHFVRRFQTLRFVALFAAIVAILAALASLAQVRDTSQAPPEFSAVPAASTPSQSLNLPGTGKARHASTGISQARKPASTGLDSGSVSFLPAVSYGSGPSAPSSVAVADFNGDGKPDVVISNTQSTVGVLLGNGDGTLQSVTTYSSGLQQSSIAVGDFNGDGKLDIVTSGESNSVPFAASVLLGNGEGGFQPVAEYSSGGVDDNSVVVADVNGDGKPDIVIANWFGSNGGGDAAIGVLLGKGDGTFEPTVSYDADGFTANAVAVADVNGDGKLDILVADAGCNSCSTSVVAVLLGNGDGTFQPATTYSTGGAAGAQGFFGGESLAVADVDGDGNPDVVVANSQSNTVGVLLGNGDGTFQPAVTYATGGTYPDAVAIADLNGDGKPDLIAVNRTEGTLAVLLGNGDGTFQTAVTFSTGGTEPNWVFVADLNGDGKPDLVVANEESGTVTVLLNNSNSGSPTTTTLASSLNPSNYGQSVTFTATVTSTSGTPTGTVIFYDGSTAIGSATLASGSAAISTSSLPAGSNSITASYQGSSSFAPSTSAALTQVVNGAATTTSLVSSLNPSNFGQSVTFTAAVTSSSGTPTGTVIFYDGSTAIGSATLASGSAAISTSSLAAGSHSITAAYQGSGGFAPSTSPVLTQVVNGTTIATTTTLATSKNPGVYQQPVTFTATVTSASGTPTGAVVFFEDTKHAMGSATLVNGIASFTISTLKRDKYAITAAYQGSGNFQPSTSGVLEEWINLSGLFPSHVVLRGSGSPSLVGQGVTFTAYVSSRYGLIPDGDLVDFFSGYDYLGTGTIENRAASITTYSLRAGVFAIYAYYEGDDDFHSNITHQVQTVDKDPTTTTVSASPNPAVYGQAVTYTATVTSSYGTPTGNVRISDIGLVPLVNGVATITKNLVRAGTHDITAAYQSDSDFARSTSAVYKEVVTPSSTTTVLTSSANPSSPGQAVTFTATVTSSAGVNPFGTVTFTAGSATLGTVALKDGVASVSTASLSEGSTLITATYNGADSFTGSSASLTQVVQ